MERRRFVLVGVATVLVVLLYLTVRLVVAQGINARVILSLVILAVLGFGVVGALTQPPDE